MSYDAIDPEEIIERLKAIFYQLKENKKNAQLNTKQEVKMVKQLPEFKGYTVDEGLRQFRKVDREKPSIDFVDFDSEKGKELLAQYEEKQDEQ
jgi:hypothetical protein